MKSSAAKRAPRPALVAPPRTLILGWGNDLRGDDGAGPAVLDQLAATADPSVTLCTVHQLTPELAPDLAEMDRVVFVDACPAASASPVQLRPLAPCASGGRALGHHLDAAALLALSAALYGRAPAAWLVGVPAVDFEVGAPFTAITAQGVHDAAAAIRAWLVATPAVPVQRPVFSDDNGVPLALPVSA